MAKRRKTKMCWTVHDPRDDGFPLYFAKKSQADKFAKDTRAQGFRAVIGRSKTTPPLC
jgi:hypothetical protein